jgi:hypothetical protein
VGEGGMSRLVKQVTTGQSGAMHVEVTAATHASLLEL